VEGAVVAAVAAVAAAVAAAVEAAVAVAVVVPRVVGVQLVGAVVPLEAGVADSAVAGVLAEVEEEEATHE